MTRIDIEPRSQATVCPYLRMDGTAVTTEQLAAAQVVRGTPARFSLEQASRHEWTCGAEPLHLQNTGYVRDVCTTAHCRECPFLPFDFVPAPLPVVITPKPSKRKHGKRKPHVWLKPRQKQNILKKVAAGEPARAIAEQYKVDRQTVYRIWNKARKEGA